MTDDGHLNSSRHAQTSCTTRSQYSGGRAGTRRPRSTHADLKGRRACPDIQFVGRLLRGPHLAELLVFQAWRDAWRTTDITELMKCKPRPQRQNCSCSNLASLAWRRGRETPELRPQEKRGSKETWLKRLRGSRDTWVEKLRKRGSKETCVNIRRMADGLNKEGLIRNGYGLI